jgi:hypothetical protein
MFQQNLLSIASMIANLASLTPNSELSIILDSNVSFSQEQVLEQLNELQVPFLLFDINSLKRILDEFPPEECPEYDILPEDPIPSNEKANWLIPTTKYHR